MSISLECAKEHANDPAVLCCRAEEGVVLSSHNLEDPAIFDDLVESGLLNLDGCLTIKEVIGATLTKTCDSLTPSSGRTCCRRTDCHEHKGSRRNTENIHWRR